MMGFLAIAILTLLVLLITKIVQAGWILLWRPYALTKYFEKQGIKGPPYYFLHGSLKEMTKLRNAAKDMVLDVNSNDIMAKAFPHYHTWSSIYGETTLHWSGASPVITIPDPELVKQILSNKFGFYEKPAMRPTTIALAGKGLGILSGVDWARHRRILNPAFSTDKLKGMVRRMAACTLNMLDDWKTRAVIAEDQCLKIEIKEEFQNLTADVIAHTGFGSSYVEGKEAFKALQELQKACAGTFSEIFIPGTQYLPTPFNLKIWKLDKEVRKPLKRIIEARMKSQANSGSDVCYEDDLLGLMLGALDADNKASPQLNMDEVIEECKSFFFAGYETTSNLLTWTIFLLSLNQDWQERLRQDVLKECGMAIPDANMLSKLKLANMVFLETLRLYPPVLWLVRQASKDMKLGELMIPKDTQLAIPIVKIHRMKEYWGDDAYDFNPMRFINGISKAAKHPNALLAFAVGPRACIGQNFAMFEAKTVLALLLQRFSFTLSPDYKHAPANNVILQPQYGLPVIAKPLHS